MTTDSNTDQPAAQPLLAESRPGLAALIAVGVFFAGGALGSALSACLAPGSGIAAMVGLLALPAAFMLSLILWQGFTILAALLQLIAGRRHKVRGRSVVEGLTHKAGLLLPLPLLFATVAGAITGLAGDSGFITSVLTYLAAGLAYGLLCRALGSHGALPLLGD